MSHPSPTESRRMTFAAKMDKVEMSKISAIADLARDNPDVIKLWIGEPDMSTPDFVSKAAHEALLAGHTRYTYARGVPALHDALVRYHARHWNVDLTPDRLSITVGGMNAVMQALQAVAEPGDEVIHLSPVWPNIVEAMRVAGITPVAVNLTSDGLGTFSLEPDAIEKAVTGRTRAIFINSPGNPSGWIMSEQQMQALLEFARARDLWIISDEVYNHFTYEGRPIASSFLQFATSDDKLIVTNTFSKNWAMTGWRLGWVVFPPCAATIFQRLSNYNTTGAATFLQYGAIAALDFGDQTIAAVRASAEASRNILVESFSQIVGRKLNAPPGGLYLMVDVSEFGDGQKFAENLLARASIGVAPGGAFGSDFTSYIRVCFAIQPDTAAVVAMRIAEFVKQQP